DGMLTPVASHAIPAGQGFIGLSIFLGLGGGSLTIYTYVELAVLLLALITLVGFYEHVKPLVFLVPSIVLFFASRSFGSYLITLIPAALIAAATIERIQVMRLKIRWRFTTVGAAVLLLTGLLAYNIMTPRPLNIAIVSVHTTGELQTIDEITISITNNLNSYLNPVFTIQEAGTTTAAWHIASGGPDVGPNGSTIMTITAPNFYAMPGIGGGFQVVAYTDQPATVSVSPVFRPQQIHLGLIPVAINSLIPLNQTTVVKTQLLDEFDRPVKKSGVQVYMSQIVYNQYSTQIGLATISTSNGNSNYWVNIENEHRGMTPVIGYTNSQGVATFYIRGGVVVPEPTYFEANLVNGANGYPYGYSEILPIRFTGPQ
ncbi:MAG: hypothetical protein HKL80_03540, partial [Acidimicrobiales bacterium]|nr:hypothetical protein [Acidimicrobiales bacterium]